MVAQQIARNGEIQGVVNARSGEMQLLEWQGNVESGAQQIARNGEIWGW